MFTNWKIKKKVYKAVKVSLVFLHLVFDRQGRAPGVNPLGLRDIHVVLVGMGGINSVVGQALCRKGVGRITGIDGDSFDATNLNRQLCYRRDIGKNKAIRGGKNMRPHAVAGTEITAYGHYFEDLMAMGIKVEADVFVCGVDNNAARLAVADYCNERGIPCIHIAVDLKAEAYSVMIQEPGGATLRDAFPDLDPNSVLPCRVPAVLDPIMAASGYALYGLDAVLQSRPIDWNLRIGHLAGFVPDIVKTVQRQDTQDEIHGSHNVRLKRRYAGTKVSKHES